MLKDSSIFPSPMDILPEINWMRLLSNARSVFDCKAVGQDYFQIRDWHSDYIAVQGRELLRKQQRSGNITTLPKYIFAYILNEIKQYLCNLLTNFSEPIIPAVIISFLNFGIAIRNEKIVFIKKVLFFTNHAKYSSNIRQTKLFILLKKWLFWKILV